MNWSVFFAVTACHPGSGIYAATEFFIPLSPRDQTVGLQMKQKLHLLVSAPLNGHINRSSVSSGWSWIGNDNDTWLRVRKDMDSRPNRQQLRLTLFDSVQALVPNVDTQHTDQKARWIRHWNCFYCIREANSDRHHPVAIVFLVAGSGLRVYPQFASDSSGNLPEIRVLRYFSRPPLPSLKP